MPVCIGKEYRCVSPYADAGKACTDSAQCAGECLIDLTVECTEPGKCTPDPVIPAPGEKAMGTCQRNDYPCGSFVYVRDGKAEPMRHFD